DNTDKESGVTEPKSKSGGSMPVYLLSLLTLVGLFRKLRVCVTAPNSTL
ncbi:GlyGly-CTERM sorting domain-containing protein, partial [Pseudoalteromonas sp. PS5]